MSRAPRKACQICKRTKPDAAYRCNAAGYRRRACIKCETAKEAADTAKAIKLRQDGARVQEIAARLRRDHRFVRRVLKEAGLNQPFKGGRTEFMQRGTAETFLPIGSIPPGSPLYELDQEMARARRMIHRANPWPTQSSLA